MSELTDLYRQCANENVAIKKENFRLRERVERIYTVAEGHYWDSFEKDRTVVLKHLRFILDEALKDDGGVR